jgi:protein-S-isoprenylcysteine O-methyltransferase Ste14
MTLNPSLLYLIQTYTVLAGWILFAVIFLFRRKQTPEKSKKSEPASIIGIILQGIALGLVWLGRPPLTPILPLGVWFEIFAAVLAILLVIASLWLMSAAVCALGKQWSMQARVLEDHALIRHGPYRIVRHPIYTGMLGMLMAAGLTWTHWIGFVASVLFFSVGTIIRVRSEEKLLREQFGAAFDDYKRKVPAVIPLKLSR